MNQLASLLKSLPPITLKTTMWLVYKDAKPMTSITTDFDWSFNPLSDPQKYDLQAEKAILNWLSLAGISYAPSQRFGSTIHISKDPQILEKNRQLELDESVEAHTFRGTAYGFGSENAVAYAQAVQTEPMFPNNLVIHAALVPELANKDWYPYIGFLVRQGHELEDAKIAQKWAEICRRDIPEIAREYEQDRMKDDIPFRESLQKIYNS